MSNSIHLRKLALAMHEKQLAAMHEIPPEGILVDYYGKHFRVLPSVFIPHEDSLPLVKNLFINRGDRVLDLCTGSGIIAVFAAYAGAGHVLAVDINPAAVRAAQINAKLHGFEKVIEVCESDMFSEIDPHEKFNIITANVPFMNRKARDVPSGSMWDTKLHVHRHFFENLSCYLKEDGVAYIAQSNFGAVEEMRNLADTAGFIVTLISSAQSVKIPDIEFYAYKLTRKFV